MVNNKGRMIYVPPVIIDEVENIMQEEDLDTRPEAFRKLVKYARVGREAKRLSRFDFSPPKPRLPVDAFTDYPRQMFYDIPKKKKRGVLF